MTPPGFRLLPADIQNLPFPVVCRPNAWQACGLQVVAVSELEWVWVQARLGWTRGLSLPTHLLNITWFCQPREKTMPRALDGNTVRGARLSLTFISSPPSSLPETKGRGRSREAETGWFPGSNGGEHPAAENRSWRSRVSKTKYYQHSEASSPQHMLSCPQELHLQNIIQR